MTACPIRYQRQVPDRKGKIFYTSITSLSHISKARAIIVPIPCNELDAVFAMCSRQYRAVEVGKDSVIALQPAGFQSLHGAGTHRLPQGSGAAVLRCGHSCCDPPCFVNEKSAGSMVLRNQQADALPPYLCRVMRFYRQNESTSLLPSESVRSMHSVNPPKLGSISLARASISSDISLDVKQNDPTALQRTINFL